MTATLRQYEVSVPALGFVSFRYALSAGKARYDYLLDIQDAYEDLTFSDIKVKSLGPVVDRRSVTEVARDLFNAMYPIGTPVRYWTGVREGEGQLSRTRSVAVTMCDHASVWVEGQSSCIALSHIAVTSERAA